VFRLAPAPLALAVSAVLSGGCLDAGPTPLGRHLVTGRAPEQVELIDGAVGAPRRILLSRAEVAPGNLGLSVDGLSTVDDPGPGGGPVEPRIIADQVGSALGHCATSTCPRPIDSRGRLYLYKPSFVPFHDMPQAVQEIDNLIRVDPATGDQHDFGPASIVQLSANRSRIVITPASPNDPRTQPSPPPKIIVDVDADDRTSMLDPFAELFADDDLYVRSTDGVVSVIPRGSLVPEPVAKDVDLFSVQPTARGPVLVLTRFGASPTGGVSATLLDTTTRTEETLPPTTAVGSGLTLSPSGRFVATQGAPDLGGGGPPVPSDQIRSTTTLTLYDRDTKQETVATVDNELVSPEVFRPNHEGEAWFVEVGDDLFRWRAGAQPEKIGHADSPSSYPILGLPSPQELPLQGQPVFTPDGAFRLVVESLQSTKDPVDLQSADDASAPPLRLNPPGLGVAGLWPLADGTLVVENWLKDARRNDIYVADPVARTQRLIASTGNVVATGRDRCLALLHWVATGGSGDLTVVDDATGEQTLIAQNVHSVAVDASPDASDALAPGTRVAFLVRNRIASPYDGLWVMELP
jgi:hypothetical protein